MNIMCISLSVYMKGQCIEMNTCFSEMEKRIEEILKTLTLREKVALLSGEDFWSTFSFPEKDVNKVTVTDGPHGVRIGNESSSRSKDGTATAFPTGVAMASTWNQQLIYDVAIALAEETRANGCDILLGPCVNIVRTPLAGRNFETYAEDPYLAGKIGVSYVKGLQSRGVGASLKHFACNNQEFERTRGDSTVDERTLREIYLTAFEMIVKEANPWSIMCSYNRINGDYASENTHLLTEVLRDDWGYDGVVVSDWNANHEIYKSVQAGLDLEMPGPYTYFGHFLEGAVKSWKLDESYIDRAVRRIIRMGKRVEEYNVNNPEDEGKFSDSEHIDLAFQTAAESMILLKNNENVLPIDTTSVKKLAVVGPLSELASYGGGGSSIVNCEYTTTPMDGIRKYYGEDVEILYAKGCEDKVKADSFSSAGIHVNHEGNSGFREEYYANRAFKGEIIKERMTDEVDFWQLFPDDKRIDDMNYSVIWSGEMDVDRTGDYLFKFSYQGLFKLYIDDELIESDMDWHDKPPYAFYTIKKTTTQLSADKTHTIRLEFMNTLENERSAMIMKVMYQQTEEDIDRGIQEALEMVKQADRTIVFAGHAPGFEQEGIDRDDMMLPGEQNRLIQAVCKADPDAVVVINTGSPIEMPWIDEVKAVVQAHFYGQEGGHALGAVISGQVNPSGRLTTTYPLHYKDNPTYLYYPGERKCVYGEGIFVGYRYYDYRDMSVLFPFGHGLSYADFEYESMELTGSLDDNTLQVKATVVNTSSITGKEVVQLYVENCRSEVLRPVRELKGFTKLELKPGEKQQVSIPLDKRAFSYYDIEEDQFVVEKGIYKLNLGQSSRNILLNKSYEVN